MASSAATASSRLDAFRSAVGRITSPDRGELIPIMARRELFRVLTGARSRQATATGLFLAALLCLLIPLHRAYGGNSERLWSHYFVIYTVVVQLGLFLSTGRAVWAGMRHDAASGSIEELLLAGARGTQVLLGKWLGLSLAGLLWTLMLVPMLMFAAALTGATALGCLRVLVSWALTATLGAMLGALFSLSERAPVAVAAPMWGFLQFWFMFRAIGKFGSGGGTWWSAALMWARNADPFTLVPAAVGRVNDPWWFKVAMLVLLMGGVAIWMVGAEREFPSLLHRAPKKDAGDYFSLRPVRAWLSAHRAERAADYTREVVYPFEWAYGWRMRVSLPMWICVMGITVVPGLIAAIAGPALHARVLYLVVLEVGFAAVVGAFGMAASLLAEREQRRWIDLYCAPLQLEEILTAKWRACSLETRPLWVAALFRGLLFGLAGLMPWRAVPIAVLAVPVAAAVSAAVCAALCANATTLTTAQQRALLWLVFPFAGVVVCRWLLPGLDGTVYLSLPHLLSSALRFEPGPIGPLQALVSLGAYSLLGLVALKAALWQLRRWPPV